MTARWTKGRAIEDAGRGRRGSCWTMSTASQASRSGPIDSKRVCSTLKSRSLLPFLSLPSTDRHHSFPLPLISPTFCLSFMCMDVDARVCSSARVRRKRCNGGRGWVWGWRRDGHGPANPKSPFPRYKASSLFSASILHIARLRAATLCERSIGATDKTES